MSIQRVQNKCIRDDTKADARESQSKLLLENPKKIKYGEKRFTIWRIRLLSVQCYASTVCVCLSVCVCVCVSVTLSRLQVGLFNHLYLSPDIKPPIYPPHKHHANFGVNRPAGCREIVDRTNKQTNKHTYSKYFWGGGWPWGFILGFFDQRGC